MYVSVLEGLTHARQAPYTLPYPLISDFYIQVRNEKLRLSQAWRFVPLIPVLRKQRQTDHCELQHSQDWVSNTQTNNQTTNRMRRRLSAPYWTTLSGLLMCLR